MAAVYGDEDVGAKMSVLDVKAIRARCDAATAGPWIAHLNGRVSGPEFSALSRDPDFIAHARTDLPACLDEIERLTNVTEEQNYLRVVSIDCGVCGYSGPYEGHPEHSMQEVADWYRRGCPRSAPVPEDPGGAQT